MYYNSFLLKIHGKYTFLNHSFPGLLKESRCFKNLNLNKAWDNMEDKTIINTVRQSEMIKTANYIFNGKGK